MSEIWRQALGIARSGWRAQYNRIWRFSRFKSGAMVLAMQLGMILLVSRRAQAAGGGAAGAGLLELMVLIGLQFGWFGLLYGFSRGQFQLYTGVLVPLFQMTPTRPIAFLIGRVLEAVPQRAWTALLWGWAYSAALPWPAAERWAAALVLALSAISVGMLTHLTGLLTLAVWSRISPRTLRTGLFLGFAATLGLATWGIIYLAGGGSLAGAAATLRSVRSAVFAAVAAVGGLPGLVLAGAFLVRPGWVEDLYRQGLYQVLELEEQNDARPRRSFWLPLPGGVLRPVLSREWLTLSRSVFTRLRLMVWAAGAVGVWAAGGAAAGQGRESALVFIGTLSLLAWGLSFSNMVTNAFTSERVTVALYRLAGIRALPLLAAKFISVALPAALLVAAAAGVGIGRAGLEAADGLWLLGWVLVALAAGTATSLGLAAATAGEDPEEPGAGPRSPMGMQPMPNTQNPMAVPWALARTGGLVFPMAVAIWAGAGQLWLPQPLPAAVPWAVLAMLPAAALLVGGALMYRDWEQGGSR